jgi:dinuclear metal center YbgI/SA1388 family protein
MQQPQCFVSDVIKAIARLAPPELAEPWDNVGLQVGHPAAPVARVLVALELTAPVLEEARSCEADLILTHHPLIFKPWNALNLAQPGPALAAEALRAGVAVLAAHTNLDAAAWSTAHAVAERLGWQINEPLLPRESGAGEEPPYKFVVFTPQGYEEAVIEAIVRGGGGQIGAYSHCTFRSPGVGTFRGETGTTPFLGEAGRLENVEEFRLEALVPARARGRVQQEVRAVHPYETMACDWIPLGGVGGSVGLGGVVKLAEPLNVQGLAELCRAQLGVTTMRRSGPAEKKIRRVAICTGSGGSFIGKAAMRADALLTGEITYHQGIEAHQRGVAVLELGHFESEVLVTAPLARRLSQDEKLAAAGVEVLAAQRDLQPFEYLN